MTRPIKFKLITIFIFFPLAIWSPPNSSRGLVQCTSSYIDDYFLPSAKIALNKIKQSLTTNTNQDAGPSERLRDLLTSEPVQPQPTSNSSSSTTTPTTVTSSSRQAPDEQQSSSEPNKNEFVNLEVGPGDESSPSVLDVSQQRAGQQRDEPTGSVISSSDSSSEDFTESITRAAEENATRGNVGDGEQSNETSTKPLVESEKNTDNVTRVEVSEAELNSVEPGHLDAASSASPAATSTTTSTPTSTAMEISQSPTNEQQQQPQTTTKSSEESIRATELEAIAAVDASIGFGDSSSSSSWFATTSDACYDEYGNARYCEPEFENVAFERQLEVSSECGHPPSRFCTANLNERNNDQIRNCHICDNQHPKKRHPATYLTDTNNPNAPTCWVSAPIGASRSLSSTRTFNSTIDDSEVNSVDQQRDNVTITINLDKRYEITYISLQFCSLRPDSLAILKSVDFGKTWSAYQFFSSQCSRYYDKTPVDLGSDHQLGGRFNSATGLVEAICVNSSTQMAAANNGRVAFSTSVNHELESQRNSSLGHHQEGFTSALQDWTTATNVKIVLDRHQASWIQSSLGHSHHHQSQQQPSQRSAVTAALTTQANVSTPAMRLNVPARSPASPSQIAENQNSFENSLTNPSDTYNYALSDLTIGGRCKCNGHASRCVHSATGRLQCDCQHNTDGADCEKCLPLHHDRPWQRATQANANPCQPCNCNGHSRKCRFDPELYLLSGKRSGGVCIDCKDNTTGRHCNYCKEGFTRDHTRPMSDQSACKLCDCHPVGSLGKVCNHLTGQCPCKEGVTGLECNRCAPGYQQSSSPTEPCIKLPENHINYEPAIEVATAGVGDEQSNLVVSYQPTSDQEPSLDLGPLEPVETSSRMTPLRQRPQLVAPESNHIDSVDEADPPAGVSDNGYELALAGDEMPERRPLDRDPQLGHRTRPKHHWGNYPPRYLDENNNDFLTASGGSMRNRQDAAFDGPNRNRFAHMPQRHNYYSKWPVKKGYTDFMPLPPRSIENIQSNYDEEGGGNGGGGGGGGGGEGDEFPRDLPDPGYASAIYEPSDATSYNQIMGLTRLHNSNSPRYMGSNRHHNQNQQHRYQMGRPMASGHKSAKAGVSLSSPSGPNLSCAGCQTRIKKLNSKQFCHLDYAIRARVINRLESSDWTKYEVEIQDIFKSPSSSLSLGENSASIQGNKLTDDQQPIQKSSKSSLDPIDSPIQSGDSSNGDQPMAFNQTLESGSSEQQQQTAAANSISSATGFEHPIHRLRVGSVQKIWVPTEDVNCRCPRLKLHSSYLLMGLVDALDQSAASIQLDRHGVSLVWRPILQEKLIKYQRLHSEGFCWRRIA